MRQIAITVGMIVLCATSVGCPAWRWRYPWQPPGSMYDQANRATIHDPFPDNQIGANVEGIRPREFASPSAQPVRDRYWVDSQQRR